MAIERAFAPDGDADAEASEAYVSPLADFVLLVTVTLLLTIAAVALIVP